MNHELTKGELDTLKTYNFLAENWDKEHDSDGYWQRELDRFYELMLNGALLEVGCGAGRDAKQLLKRNFDYLGTDIAPGLLDVAKRKNPTGEFREINLYDFENSLDRQFDGFWCSAVLLHIPKNKLDQALQSIKSALKKGAVGFISVKEGNGEKIEISEIDGKQLERTFYYYERPEFERALTLNGFQIVDFLYKPMTEKTKWLCFFVTVK